MRKTIVGSTAFAVALAAALAAPAPALAADGADMYRLYNPNSGEHFYTASAGERENLKSAGWRSEGTGWVAPASGEAVYRLYNPNGGDHHYSVSAGERDALVRAGWSYEGVGWMSGGSVPVYRLYNPRAKTGSHHYTTSAGERDLLVRAGWSDEGVGWQAAAVGRAEPSEPEPTEKACRVRFDLVALWGDQCWPELRNYDYGGTSPYGGFTVATQLRELRRLNPGVQVEQTDWFGGDVWRATIPGTSVKLAYIANTDGSEGVIWQIDGPLGEIVDGVDPDGMTVDELASRLQSYGGPVDYTGKIDNWARKVGLCVVQEFSIRDYSANIFFADGVRDYLNNHEARLLYTGKLDEGFTLNAGTMVTLTYNGLH